MSVIIIIIYSPSYSYRAWLIRVPIKISSGRVLRKINRLGYRAFNFVKRGTSLKFKIAYQCIIFWLSLTDPRTTWHIFVSLNYPCVVNFRMLTLRTLSVTQILCFKLAYYYDNSICMQVLVILKYILNILRSTYNLIEILKYR